MGRASHQQGGSQERLGPLPCILYCTHFFLRVRESFVVSVVVVGGGGGVVAVGLAFWLLVCSQWKNTILSVGKRTVTLVCINCDQTLLGIAADQAHVHRLEQIASHPSQSVGFSRDSEFARCLRWFHPLHATPADFDSASRVRQGCPAHA